MRKNINYKKHIEELVNRCVLKDAAAWDEFVRLISPLIFSVIGAKFKRSGFTCQKSDIDNIKQDILLSIWQKNKLSTIKDKENVISWVCAISIHAACDHIRSIKPFDLPRAGTINNSMISSRLTPLEELLKKNTQKDIKLALASLKPKELIILKLAIIYGKKYREISRILKMPLSALLVCAYRTRQKLKKKLKQF